MQGMAFYFACRSGCKVLWWVRLSVREDISGITNAIFTKFFELHQVSLPPTAFKGKTTPEFCATFVLFAPHTLNFVPRPLREILADLCVPKEFSSISSTVNFCTTFVLFCAAYAEFYATPLWEILTYVYTVAPVKIPWKHLDLTECNGVHMAYVRISHKGRGTKFGIYGTKQHKSSTKFTVLQIIENSVGTRRPTRMQQCTHGIMSESATRSMAQNSAYTAQNSTKVAQNSRCFRPVKIAWGHRYPQECNSVHMA